MSEGRTGDRGLTGTSMGEDCAVERERGRRAGQADGGRKRVNLFLGVQRAQQRRLGWHRVQTILTRMTPGLSPEHEQGAVVLS